MADTLPTAPAGMGGNNELGDPMQQPQQQGPTNELGDSLPQQQQPQQQQAPDPDQAQAQHDQMFGKIAKQLLGMQNNYSVGADGKLQNNPQPEKAGDLFRKLLGSALLGPAAGANGDSRQGFLGGLARGGAAAVQNNQQQDQQQRQQAQQDFANNQHVEQETRENTLMNATVAHMHAETVAKQHTSDLQDAAAHLAHSNASAALTKTLTDAGGVPAIIPVGGQPSSEFTANDLAASYIKDPSILKGPQGFVRHFIDQTDSSDLTYNGTNWVTSDGTPANLTNHTTVKAIDVPINAMSAKVATTGKDINAAYGGRLVDPAITYQMSPLDMDALNTKRMATAKANLADELEKKRVALAGMQIALDGKRLNAQITTENRASFDGADKQIGEQIKTLQTQLKDPLIDPAVKKTAQAHLDQANTELKAIRKKLYPATNVDDELNAASASLANAPKVPSVSMLNPQGQQVSVPQDKVDAAMKNGYQHTGPAADPSVGLNQRNSERRQVVSDALGAITHIPVL